MLYVDVNGYIIVNIYKPPPTRLQSLDLPVFPHPLSSSGDFNGHHVDWDCGDNKSAWLAGQVLIVLLPYTITRIHPAFTLAAGKNGTNLNLALASVGSY